jgi:hypothetical protein
LDGEAHHMCFTIKSSVCQLATHPTTLSLKVMVEPRRFELLTSSM